jgi:hypothetical protein
VALDRLAEVVDARADTVQPGGGKGNDFHRGLLLMDGRGLRMRAAGPPGAPLLAAEYFQSKKVLETRVAIPISARSV